VAPRQTKSSRIEGNRGADVTFSLYEYAPTDETDAPLVVDTDAPLPCSIAT